MSTSTSSSAYRARAPAAGARAESDEGDKFLWTTNGTDPRQWPVTVASRNGGWWHYEGGAVQFLAGYCDGGLEPRGASPGRP
ncbi:hypothetical protein [Streptomyces sp. NPDC000931]|uniref:hypothetical protein n=1 Tax=Streptomyces sp. NPDC000931 TaxID=3154372 RepID=UPI00332E135F